MCFSDIGRRWRFSYKKRCFFILYRTSGAPRNKNIRSIYSECHFGYSSNFHRYHLSVYSAPSTGNAITLAPVRIYHRTEYRGFSWCEWRVILGRRGRCVMCYVVMFIQSHILFCVYVSQSVSKISSPIIGLFQYTAWPRKNGKVYFPQNVDAITNISVWGNFSWEKKWYQDHQLRFSSLFSRAHFVRQCRGLKFSIISLNLTWKNATFGLP